MFRAVLNLVAFSVVTTALIVEARVSAEPFDLQIRSIPSPSAGVSGQPQLTVSSRGVLLSWIEREGSRATLKFAERTAAGWSGARTVASGDDWLVNWADVPGVVRLSNGSLAAHWLRKNGGGVEAYDVQLARSRDDGRTWSPVDAPHHDGTKTQHGFVSPFEMAGGSLGLIWLDGRNPSAMTLRAGAFDRNGKQTADALIDERVCDCCPTAAAITSDGPLVAFRNRTTDEIRDIYVSRFQAGRWSEPKAVHNDGWNITGCPVNGPALSANGKRVAIAWFTGQGASARTFVAFSSDSGTTFSEPVRVDDAGSIGRVDVELLPDGSALALWIESASGKADLRVRRIAPSGSRSDSIVVSAVPSTRSIGNPRVARSGNEIVFAWTGAPAAGGGNVQIHTAAGRLPGR